MGLPAGPVLVLGGAGFIGSHLVSRLVNEGHEVHFADVEFPPYRAPLWKRSTMWQRDLRNQVEFADLMLQVKPTTVFQLAADMGGVEYFHSSADWAASVNNGLINQNVLSFVAEVFPKTRVVFTSTACAYATECQIPDLFPPIPGVAPSYALEEEDIKWGTPDQLYGQEKRNSALLYLAAPFDARVAALHTVYGPGQEHSGIKMKFPSAVAQKARRARETKKLQLIGDGTQIRTFLFIKDAIDRLLILASLDENPGLVNIGDDTTYTCEEVGRVAMYAAGFSNKGYDIEYVSGPTGVAARSSDNTKARKVFGEESLENPTDLAHGMAALVQWLDEIGAEPYVAH